RPDADRRRRASMRSARPHPAHPGSPHSAAARHVRRHRRSTAGRSLMFRKPAISVRPLVLAVMVASSAWAVSACAPIVLGGAYVGTMAATDRRTVGIQVEDKNIE